MVVSPPSSGSALFCAPVTSSSPAWCTGTSPSSRRPQQVQTGGHFCPCPHAIPQLTPFNPAAELASRLTTDVTLASNVFTLNINVMLRNLGQVLGLCAFMLGLSPRLTMLALLEVPLAIAARKVYNSRHQVMAGVGMVETGWQGWIQQQWDGNSGKSRRAGWGSWVQHSQYEMAENSRAGMGVGWRGLGHAMRADSHCSPQLLQRAVLDAAADAGAAVQESISSIETVRVFNGEEEEEHRYRQALDKTLQLRDQRDTEKAIFLLIRRVRLA